MAETAVVELAVAVGSTLAASTQVGGATVVGKLDVKELVGMEVVVGLVVALEIAPVCCSWDGGSMRLVVGCLGSSPATHRCSEGDG